MPSSFAVPRRSILIVDDEKPVRDFLQVQLASDGFTVWSAESGKDALSLIAEKGIRVSLLITDVLMPFMNGRELATRISQLRPAIRVLFISAYSAEILTGYGVCPAGVDLLRKPFTGEELLGRVNRMLTVSPTWKELMARAG